MRRLWGGVVLLCLGVVALCSLLWFGFGKDPSAVPDPLVGHRAPSFALLSTGDKVVNLKSLRGHPVLINFFASWCVSCEEQEGNLVAAYDRWHRQVKFLGIVYQDKAQAAFAFTRSHGGRWIDLVDSHSGTAINYGVTGVPETFFLNRRGTIVYHTVSLQPSAIKMGILKAMRA